MRLGAHVSTAGGVDKAVGRAQEIGAETIQIFGASPQSWRRRELQPAEVEAFRDKAQAAEVAPTFLHGVYLVNLATSNPDNLTKSQVALTHDMHVCHLLSARGVIFHIGSHRGAGLDGVFRQVTDSLRRVIDETPEETWLILENSAGMGDAIGSRFGELALFMREVASPRLKVCLDTQHMFASGYDVKTREGLERAMEEFEREVGLAQLVAVHANDSKCSLGGGVDRHENIGEGHIGRDGFANIMGHPAFQAVPFLLEVPGFGNLGPDKENLDILKAIRASL
ncbi:MAG: deoxyribonuclease IV [Dehalococcoidia bacterium]